MVETSTSNIMVQGCNLGNTDHYILVPGPLYFQVARLILLDILLPQTRIVAWLVHFTSPKTEFPENLDHSSTPFVNVCPYKGMQNYIKVYQDI